MAKRINEAGFSLLPNLGLTGQTVKPGGTVGTTTSTGLNTPGSKTQQVVQTTAATTKQINDLVAKIAAQKQKAAQSSTPEQQALLQSVNMLQKQLQQLVTPGQEEGEESVKQKIAKAYKEAGKKTGEALAGAIKAPFLGKALGKIGEYNSSQMSKFIGLESKNKHNDTINNNAKTMKKKKKTPQVKELKEGIAGKVVGGAAKGAAGGAAIGAGLGALGLGPAGSVIGSAIGGALAGAPVGGAVGAASNDEDQENFDKLTPIQDEVVNALAKNKYYVNRVSYQFAEEEGGPTVFMSKKPTKYSTRYAEVSPDGFVNGESIEDFLKGHEENEEKMLSRNQQRIASLAGDPNKIDAADFAKLKAMKESAKIPAFIKAILQKNYAVADKYLGSMINEKIKNHINTALDKPL